MDAVDIVLELIEWIIFFVLLAVGFFVGRFLENQHYVSIRQREKIYAPVLAFGARFPPDMKTAQDCRLVCGCVVISSDYFKKFVLGLRNFIGGRSRGYETLLDRGRREATLRMKMEARRMGAKMVVNVKYESTAISGSRGGVPAFEVICYGTALIPSKVGMVAAAAP
jgi:uncharacterized protein YbjQ (UPF0145 family)